MESIKQWYTSLQASEQRMVMIATVFFSSVLIFILLIQPLNQHRNKLLKQIEAKQTQLAWMRENAARVQGASAAKPGPASRTPLNNLVAQSSSQYGLRISQIKGSDRDGVQVWFDDVSFDDLLRWLDQMESSYGVTLVSINIRGRDHNGLVRANVRLRK